MYSRILFGKKFYKLSDSGFKRYLVDDIGMVYDIKKDKLIIPTMSSSNMNVFMWNDRLKKNTYHSCARIILDAFGKIDINRKDVRVFYRDGDHRNCKIENLRCEPLNISVHGMRLKFTLPTGRVFNFNNFKEFKRVYEGMTYYKFMKMIKGKKPMNGSKLEYLPQGETEWRVVQ